MKASTLIRISKLIATAAFIYSLYLAFHNTYLGADDAYFLRHIGYAGGAMLWLIMANDVSE